MRDIEAAYWRFARELRGQPAMAPYTEAYQALVNSVAPRANDTQPPPAAAQAAAEEKDTRAVRPPSKLGWPDS